MEPAACIHMSLLKALWNFVKRAGQTLFWITTTFQLSMTCNYPLYLEDKPQHGSTERGA